MFKKFMENKILSSCMVNLIIAINDNGVLWHNAQTEVCIHINPKSIRSACMVLKPCSNLAVPSFR